LHRLSLVESAARVLGISLTSQRRMFSTFHSPNAFEFLPLGLDPTAHGGHRISTEQQRPPWRRSLTSFPHSTSPVTTTDLSKKEVTDMEKKIQTYMKKFQLKK